MSGTPGPWHAERIDAEEWTISVPHELRGPLAAVYGRANVEADAKLIAAAPALADALEALLANDAIVCVCPPADLEIGGRGHIADCDTVTARNALRAAGRLP